MQTDPPPLFSGKMTLFFDAADTFIALAEPVPSVYSRFLRKHNITMSAQAIGQVLPDTFQNTPPPIYSDFPDGHAAETAWWRTMVRATVSDAGASEFAKSAEFDPFFTELFNHYALAEAWELYPDTISALDRAKSSGATLAIVSNFDNRLFPIIQSLGLEEYFDLLYNSALACSRKPDSLIFEQALALTSSEPSTTYHVGDSATKDYIGASRAGLHAYHLTRPEKTLHDFLDFASIKRSSFFS